MLPEAHSRVRRLDQAADRRARRQARAEFDGLILQAIAALADVVAGDLEAVHLANWATCRATNLAMRNQLDLPVDLPAA